MNSAVENQQKERKRGGHPESHGIPLHNCLKLKNTMVPLKLLLTSHVTDDSIMSTLDPKVK